jgi:PIN domain nuclease of toxin-antitoxin system
MRILLDTHALLWWLAGSDRLSAVAHGAIADDANEILVSAASAWEIATKHRLGRLPGAAAVAEDVTGCLLDQGFQPLAITVSDGERAGRLPGPARDPFDRMLIAQALTLDVALISVEEPFDRYGVRRLW